MAYIANRIIDVNLTHTSGTPQSIYTAGANERVRVLGWYLASSVAGRVNIQSPSAVNLINTPALAAGTPNFEDPAFHDSEGVLVAPGAGLFLDGPTGTITGHILARSEWATTGVQTQ